MGSLLDLGVIGAVGVIVVTGAARAYNGLVRGRVRARDAWSRIDVELTRRHDLILNLVEAVKGHAAHERATFEAVASARVAAVSAQAGGDPSEVGPAEDVLSQSLRTLFAVAENYPRLRAGESFVRLQEQLTGTDDKLEYSRHFYNASARIYDLAIQSFPRRFLAGAFGFRPVALFETEAIEGEILRVSFNGLGSPVPMARHWSGSQARAASGSHLFNSPPPNSPPPGSSTA